jgi:hypothetical protein
VAEAIVAIEDPGAWSLRQSVSFTMSQHVGIEQKRYLDTKGGCSRARQQCRAVHGGRQSSKSIFWRQIAAEEGMAVSFVHVR